MNHFTYGLRRMLPIAPGIIPFGAVMGTVCAEAKLSLAQTISLNVFVFAGASQLAAIDLLLKHAEIWLIVLTGIIINLRFVLYSAAISPVVQKSNVFTKFFVAYSLTDQNFAVMAGHQDGITSNRDKLIFFSGASICMGLIWHGAVILGHTFGNFAPATWSLDFAIPLSFVALMMPTFQNRSHIIVAVFSAISSISLHALPFNLGLFTTSILAIFIGVYLTKSKMPVRSTL